MEWHNNLPGLPGIVRRSCHSEGVWAGKWCLRPLGPRQPFVTPMNKPVMTSFQRTSPYDRRSSVIFPIASYPTGAGSIGPSGKRRCMLRQFYLVGEEVQTVKKSGLIKSLIKVERRSRVMIGGAMFMWRRRLPCPDI